MFLDKCHKINTNHPLPDRATNIWDAQLRRPILTISENLKLFLHLWKDLDKTDSSLSKQMIPRYVLVWLVVKVFFQIYNNDKRCQMFGFRNMPLSPRIAMFICNFDKSSLYTWSQKNDDGITQFNISFFSTAVPQESGVERCSPAKRTCWRSWKGSTYYIDPKKRRRRVRFFKPFDLLQ